MLTNSKKIAVIASTALISMFSIGAANACSSGFLADLACRAGVINQDQAHALDAAHAAMGRPLDHMANQAAGAAVNYVAPGAGVYVTQGLEMRDQFNRGGFGNGMGAPVGGPIPVNAPMMPPPPPVALGNMCGTPYGAVPYPLAPVGSFCQVPSQLGMIGGQVF